MFNSKDMCHPLSLPFVCRDIDFREDEFPQTGYCHYFAELLLIRSGRLRVLLGGEEFSAAAGETVLICPGVQHQIFPDGDEPILLTLIRMDTDRMPEFPAYSPSLKTILNEAWRARLPMVLTAKKTEELGLPKFLAQCVWEANNRSFGYDLSVVSLLSMINLEIVRFWLDRGLNLRERMPQPDPIYSLSGYIQSHLKDDLRVEELAARCGLSYPWFAKKFREVYGISCKDYIEQIRVAQVEQFLLFTNRSLKDISEATGYADCSHMIKNFKRIVGITPGQYRLKNR